MPKRDLVLSAGTLLSLLYAVLHGWWAWAGAPGFAEQESVVSANLPITLVAAVVASICALTRVGAISQAGLSVRRTCWVASLACSTLLAGYCLLLWPSLAQLLMVPFGYFISLEQLGTVALRGLGTSAAALTGAAVLPLLRNTFTINHHSGRTRWWGYAGAYLAVAALSVRMATAVPSMLRDDWSENPGGYGFALFVGLLVLAGTLLPMALVHPWGHIWPTWTGPLSGRPVPRWLVLGPGVFVSLALLTYFGFGGLTATFLGKTSGTLMEAVMILSYVLWGIGLAVASFSYALKTGRGGAQTSRVLT